MSLAFPTALLLAALAVPIAAFYILKVRLRRQPVSTHLFWKQIFDEKPPRSLFQNLRHLLSLLAQLLILGLLILAVADPYLPWQLMQARRIVLVVDDSASMQATDVDGTRLQAAKDHAQDLISGMREQDEVAILLAGDAPEVLVGMTSHVPTLRRRVDQISASDNATHLESAIKLGRQLVGEHPHGQVIVMTDGCIAKDLIDEASTTAGSPSIRWQTVGNKANNVGITQFQARRSLVDAMGYELLVSVWNASSIGVRCRLEITLDGIPIDVLPLELTADEHWQRSLEKTSIEGGVLKAMLTEIAVDSDHETSTKPNQLTVDDTATTILPTREIQKVLIVTPGNLFLRKVFAANPLVDLEVRPDFPAVWPTDTLIVLHRSIPTTLPAGDLFVVDPETDCDEWTVGGVLDHPLITEQDEQSPLMTHIQLDNVLVPEARELQFSRPVKVLAGTVTDNPIYSEIRRETGRCLLLSVNLEQSDLAFRTAFPIMVTNALSWFARQSGEIDPALSTGSILQVQLDGAAPGDYSLISPSGETFPITTVVDETSISLGPFDQAGVWTFQGMEKGTTDRQIAVNLANERETDLRPVEELSNQGKQTSFTASWLSRPIWFYLALLVGGLLTMEWFLYQRRLIT